MKLPTSLLENSRLSGRVAVGYSVLITYLLLAPSPFAPFGSMGRTAQELVSSTLADYFQHAGVYVVFAIVLHWAGRTRGWLTPTLCVTLAAGHGVTTEVLQYYIPNRFFDLTDILANLVGIGLGSWAAAWIFRPAQPRVHAAIE